MTTIGKLWTASIAYVALAVGAGLSIMYNVVDTMTVRGPALDVYDVVTAVAAPALVVLMVELFVSNWWVGQRWPMLTLRWLGCVVIGGVAMRASWTHGHDFMARRGQAADVAIAWPLAIDLLAVMATALILAGRRVRLDTVSADTVGQPQTVSDSNLSGMVTAMTEGVTEVGHAVTDFLATAEAADRITELPDVSGNGLSSRRGVDRWADLTSWQEGADRANADIGESLAKEAESYLWKVTPPEPATSADSQELPKRTSAPDEFVAMVAEWDQAGRQISRADVTRLTAAYFDVSERTARRWRVSVLGRD